MKTSVSMIVLRLMATAVAAKWLNQPTPGIPRTPDGKPRLTAPVPRMPEGTPDLSGWWRQPLPAPYVQDITVDLPLDAVTPNAATLFEERVRELGKDAPATIGCLPSGPQHVTGGPLTNLVRVVQTPQMIVMRFEDFTHRQIHLDGRKLPEDPNPSVMGYSVGRWEEGWLSRRPGSMGEHGSTSEGARTAIG